MENTMNYKQIRMRYIHEIERIREGNTIKFKYKDSPVFESLKECMQYIHDNLDTIEGVE